MVGRPEPGLTDFHIAFRVMAGMAGVATAGVLRLAADAGGELSGRVVQRAGRAEGGKLTMTTGRSVLVGLIGAGLQSSRSPFMHEQEGLRRGLNYVYRLIDLERLGLDAAALPEVLDQAQRLGFDGLNITHPCKQAVLPLLDALSPDARALGAVNTVVLRDGRRVGHNTDWWGFFESFKRRAPGAPMDAVLQLGAGGAGAATAYALLKLGAGSLLIHDTHPERAHALAERMNGVFGAGRAAYAPDPVAAAAQVRGIVQATPVGMTGRPGMPLTAQALSSEHWVAEVIYFPLETEFLCAARALGCRSVDGSGMAVFQAVRAFELFSGALADSEAMSRDFLAAAAHTAAARAAAAGL